MRLLPLPSLPTPPVSILGALFREMHKEELAQYQRAFHYFDANCESAEPGRLPPGAGAPLAALSTPNHYQPCPSLYLSAADGVIDAEELRASLATLGHPAGEAELAAILAVMDKDGSGDIDFSEFVQAGRPGGGAVCSSVFVLRCRLQPVVGIPGTAAQLCRSLGVSRCRCLLRHVHVGDAAPAIAPGIRR